MAEVALAYISRAVWLRRWGAISPSEMRKAEAQCLRSAFRDNLTRV